MVFAKKHDSVLNGAWEEPGVIGTRIEIDAPEITVLWRNAPVLQTRFSEKERDGGIELALKRGGLRYEGAFSDYAELTGLFYRDGALEMTEFFPITGESKTTLKKTDRSRYGNCVICDDVLGELRGVWSDGDGFHELRFGGGRLTCRGETISIHVLRDAGEPETSRRFRVVDADPSKYEVFYFGCLDYVDGVLTGIIPVCDAPSYRVFFKRTE